jgi:hypothetical protein
LAGGRHPSECPAGFRRNQWPPSVGISGRHQSEQVAGLARNTQIIKSRGHFPTDEAATKLIWLALRNITADWKRASKEWKSAMNQFAILYGERFTLAPR